MPSQNHHKPFKPPRQIGSSSGQSHINQAADRSKDDKSQDSEDSSIELISKKSRHRGRNARSESLSSDKIDEPRKKGGKGKGKAVQPSEPTTEDPTIPAELLSTLLHEHFQHNDTKITKEAMAVFRKYIELFVLEAIGRANEEKEEEANGKTSKSKGAQTSSDFLEVEDLEKLAPQLLLDF